LGVAQSHLRRDAPGVLRAHGHRAVVISQDDETALSGSVAQQAGRAQGDRFAVGVRGAVGQGHRHEGRQQRQAAPV